MKLLINRGACDQTSPAAKPWNKGNQLHIWAQDFLQGG